MEQRSKRAIKTPKRFDDEAFAPATKTPATSSKPAETAKPSPELSSQPAPKSIIKVKLNKVRPRISLPPIHALTHQTPPKEPTAATKTPAAASTPPVELGKESSLKETPNKTTPTTPIANNNKESPIKAKETTIKKEPKETTTTSSGSSAPALATTASTAAVAAAGATTPTTTELKEVLVKKEPRETPIKTRESVVKKEPKEPRVREPPKPKEVARLREIPKIEIRTPERTDSQLVYRPRTKRPRTPPNYVDLIPNVVLPFWDARTAAEEHEDDNVKELVHCHCGVAEELGLMVQCETCLTWQHAHCLGIEKPEDAPERYTCRACLDPKFVRESMKWAYDQDWLTQGRMKQFACDSNPLPERNVKILQKINELIGNVLNIHQIIHCLRVKHRILMNAQDEDAELKLFANQWPTNYQHADGTPFIPTVNHSLSTPASTISAIAETPDPNDITVDSLPQEVSLPDIGQLEDVSAILEGNPYMADAAAAVDAVTTAEAVAEAAASNPNAIQPMINSEDATPNDCRANLRLHIQQTEEYLGLELAHVEEQLIALEKECGQLSNSRGSSFGLSVDLLKNDLQTMRNYISHSTDEIYED